jgi:WXG100 family type VII secretion target
MAAAEDEFERILHALQTEMSDLDTAVRTHLADWEGAAATAYHGAQDGWHATAKEMTANLAWLQQVIATARKNYGSARTTNLRMWQGNR